MMNNDQPLLILGKNGRMGSLVVDVCRQFGTLYTTWIRSEGVSVLEKRIQESSLVLDVTHPLLLESVLPLCLRHKVGIFTATTGWSAEHRDQLQDASKSIPVMCVANSSMGMVCMKQAFTMFLRFFLPNMWKLSLEETHHKHKKDAPSGTMKDLIEHAKKNHFPYQLNVHRHDDVVGEHSFSFKNDDEEIICAHRVHNRRVFAYGMRSMALWLRNQHSGYYEDADYYHFLQESL